MTATNRSPAARQRRPSLRPISTFAPRRSTAARTRSRRTFSPRVCWACRCHGLRAQRRPADARGHGGTPGCQRLRLRATAALRAGATPGQRAQWIPRIAAGDTIITLAHAEPQSRYNLADVACIARRDGDAYVLDGRKVLVAHGDSADQLLVSARVHGKRTDRDGIGLWLVDARSPGVS